MTTLDAMARNAASGLMETVASADLRLALPPSQRAGHGAGQSLRWLSAGALAALVVMVGVWMLRPAMIADDIDATVVSSVPVTKPPTEPSLTVPPSSAPIPPPEVPSSTTPTTAALDVTPPMITITNPIDGSIFEEQKLAFSGTTEPGAKVFAGPYEAIVDPEGNWSIVLILSVGNNRTTFVAVDPAGNESTATVSAVYQPPTTTTTKPKEKTVAAFTAHFTFGECSEAVPYDVYYGTGEPGSTVSVISEFGSGSTVVGATGKWELRVDFPSAPIGKTVSVKAKDSLGRHVTFAFVYLGPA